MTIQAAARSFAVRPRPGYLQVLRRRAGRPPPPSSSPSGSSASAQAAVQSRCDRAHVRAAAGEFQRAAQGIRAPRRRRARPASGPSCGKPPADGRARHQTSTCRGCTENTAAPADRRACWRCGAIEAAYMLDRDFDDRGAFDAEVDEVQQDHRRRGRRRSAQESDPSDGAQTTRDAFEAWLAADARDREPRRRHRFRRRVPDPQRRRQCQPLERAARPGRRGAEPCRSSTRATSSSGSASPPWSSGWRSAGDRPHHHAAARGLASVMKRLADGDTSATIPATRAKDELGAMARAVVVFRDKMIERERSWRPTQAETDRARETARRGDRRDHHAVRDVGRPGAGQGARGRRAAGDRLHPAQRRRRLGVRRGAAPPRSASASPPATSPLRPARSRNSRRRSPGSPSRRSARPRSPAARSTRPGAPCAPCRSSAMPRPASARWSA